MLTKKNNKTSQVQIVSLEELVPQDHLLRKIENAMDWSFIYDLVKDSYSQDKGRPSMDPVMLIKIPLLQYLYGIRSMRQTIREIEVNVAYRWFLGLDLTDKVPHFTTFGKNYYRRFVGTDIFEKIFARVLEEAIRRKLVNPKEIFVDATHVKASANSKKVKREVVEKEALFYEEKLRQEINEDREAHGKKPFPDEDDHDDDVPPASDLSDGEVVESGVVETSEEKTADTAAPSSGEKTTETKKEVKEEKRSTTDPDCGWFHKGEHKEVFAYAVETACDRHGWILDYTVNRGNLHDSRTFPGLYDRIRHFHPEMLIMDSGFKTPAIAKLLLEDGIQPLFPYTRPKTKEGYFRKSEYVYDEYYDRYICPAGKALPYSTTNRDGYREYKSCGHICEKCPFLKQCTNSRNHVKVITRHLWADYLEECEDIRHTIGNKEKYQKRKETIERLFGTAKEFHGFRYTHLRGKARMEMKVALTFACMNLKKLANLLGGKRLYSVSLGLSVIFCFHLLLFMQKQVHGNKSEPVLSSG